MSENGDSESDSETDSDQDDVRERSVVRRRKKSKGVLKVTSDFAMQTDGLDEVRTFFILKLKINL